MTPVFLIPAFNPDPQLPSIVRQLMERGGPVVVVDDGSGPQCRAVFDALATIDGVTVLRHARNRGKGGALKTGINHIIGEHPDATGIVTLDADGQHSVADALRVAARLVELPNDLVVGVRDFAGRIPLRSRIGNALTRYVFGLFVGLKLRDTQSGLRGLPLAFARRLLELRANGYEFELDMLITAKESGIEVGELPIRTIYIAGNQSSHFNPILDSVRIYLSLFRYVMASFITALVDNLLFIIAHTAGVPLLPAQAFGRAGAVAVNYWLVKHTVFHFEQKHRHAVPRYLALVVVSGLISYGMILVLHDEFGIPVILAKILAETILYIVNFLVQREFVFRRRTPYRS